MGLREHRAEVEACVRNDIELVLEGGDLQRVGNVYDELSKHCRVLAGCALLLDADIDGFVDLLARSGHARVHLLRRRAEQPALRNPHLAASNADALFDVLAARQLPIALQLATLSPDTWWKGEEYEEDFLYAHFLLRHLRDPKAADLAAMVTELERATGNHEAARPRLCRALLELKQGDFDEAFESLLDEHDEVLKEDRTHVWPDGKIELRIKEQLHIEALAWLNLADAAGLSTQPEYRYCPASSRLPASRPSAPSVF